MSSQDIQAVLKEITALDSQLSDDEIRRNLNNCLTSLKVATGFKDVPLGAHTPVTPYELVQAQTFIEKALRELDLGNSTEMPQQAKAALEEVSKVVKRGDGSQ